MPLSGLLILLVLAAPAVIVGIVLIAVGYYSPPRLDMPRCADCGYDLSQLRAESVVKCPECGANLNAAGAVHFGVPQRNMMLIVIGWCLLAMPLLIIGLALAFLALLAAGV